MKEPIYSGQNRKPVTVKKGKRVPIEPVVLPIDAAPRKTNEGYLDALGREIPDPTPMAPPIGYKKVPSMVDNIRNMVRTELAKAAVESGFETFEEADDFDVGDDYDPTSPYENEFEPEIPAGAPEAPQPAQSEAPKPATPPVVTPLVETAPSSPPDSNQHPKGR